MASKTNQKVGQALCHRRQQRERRSRSQDGTIALMTAFVIIIMIAMFGFALDLSRTYNRKVELQSVSDAAALAAANALDGTSAGIDNAVKAASVTASTFSFSYNHGIVVWSPGALTFSTDAGGSGGWLDRATAKASAAKVFFARVDTSALDPAHGRVDNVLIPVLSSALATTHVSAASVAGRDSVNALPLAVCANSNVPVEVPPPSSGELVEFGFRRGVSYDLANLPGGPPSRSFLVNPIAPAGATGSSMMGNLDIVAAYVCAGKMAIPALQGGGITVEGPFPMGSLFQQFNSRFGTYITPCDASSSPADPNIKSFTLANATWIQTQPTGLSVGPLWSYAKAAKYSSWVANAGVEPVSGYSTYSAISDWGTLYPGPPAAQSKSYPATTPYQSTGGTSAYKTLYNTRVLHVPLLQCPVPPGSKVSATVLGVGKFFMTQPATSSTLYAEFAGMDTLTVTGGNARLYR